jgi:hypothetical protein
MIKLLGWVVVLGAVWMFLNWEDYGASVNETVAKVDQVAEQTQSWREMAQNWLANLFDSAKESVEKAKE